MKKASAHFHSEKCYAVGPGDTTVLVCGHPAFPVIHCEEWQCRYVFPDGRCCRRTLQHVGEHMADRGYSIGHGLTYLECPCCGDNGAASDGEGCFYDGQALICGCSGWVCVDEDGDAWINNGDEPCPDTAKCKDCN